MTKELFNTLSETLYNSTNLSLRSDRNGKKIINGLTESELRNKAMTRLGSNDVEEMSVGQIINFLYEEHMLR